MPATPVLDGVVTGGSLVTQPSFTLATVTTTVTNDWALGWETSGGVFTPNVGWASFGAVSGAATQSFPSASSSVIFGGSFGSNQTWQAGCAVFQTNGSTPTIVGGNTTNNSGFFPTASLNMVLPNPVVMGNSILVIHNELSAANNNTPTVSDNKGNVYTQLFFQNGGVAQRQVSAFIAMDAIAGATTVTFSVAGGFGSGAVVEVFEVNNLLLNIPAINAQHLYEYESIELDKRTVIATASDATGVSSISNGVVYFDGAGVTQPIFTPSAGAQDVRAVDSRDWEYFADGVQADLWKWNLNVPGSKDKWGIDAPTSPVIIGPATGGGSLTFALSQAANAVAGNTTYTGTALGSLTVGTQVQIGGFVNAGNNGNFTVVSSTATTVTVNNPGGIAEITAATLTTQNKLRPSTLLNGWGPNAHVGSYEGGVNQGFSFGLDPSTTGAYLNPGNAFDGDITTFASATRQHTHAYNGCVWSFAGIGSSATNVTLNILSEVPTSGTDGQTATLRSAGLWYSIDNGSSWIQIYDSSTFTKKYSTVAIPNGTLISNIQVMAFLDGHDDMYQKVYDIYIQATFVGSGPITLQSGRNYFVVFENSITGHLSSPSPVSTSTGAVFGGAIPIVDIPVSADPQVDKKILLATADGGDQTTLFFVAEIPNATTTFQDNTAEVDLLSNNTYASVDADGTEHGVFDNDPPPNGSFPTKHRGRIYLLKGSTLFFSKAIADLTTSTGIIAGKYEEAWPADFTMDISEGAELGNSLLSDGTVIYIGTKRHVRRLLGSGPDDFQPIEIVHGEVGVNSQDIWQFIYLEGVPVGAMWMTPDQRVIRSDFNTYNNVGITIQNTLNTINTSALQSAWAAFVGIGAYNFYVLAIPTGVNTIPNTLCVYDIARNRWFIWTPTDTIRCALYYMNLTGIPRWIFNTGTAKIYTFNPASVRDRENNTPQTFTTTLQTSWLDMSDTMLFKALNELEIGTDDTAMTLTVEGATTSKDFETPTTVITNAPLTSNFVGSFKVFLGGLQTKYRYYRFTFTSQIGLASTVQDILMDYLSAEVIPFHRF
jgi:hypothetical protein